MIQPAVLAATPSWALTAGIATLTMLLLSTLVNAASTMTSSSGLVSGEVEVVSNERLMQRLPYVGAPTVTRRLASCARALVNLTALKYRLNYKCQKRLKQIEQCPTLN